MILQPTRTVFSFEGDKHAKVSVLANCDLDADMIEAIEAFLRRQKKRHRKVVARTVAPDVTPTPA